MNQSNDVDGGQQPTPPSSESGNFYSGSESFFGVFTQAQVYVNGVRLVHDGKVTQQVSDLASQIENNRRRFLHSGDVNFALQELTRITNSYNQRVQAWESEASRRERNKKSMSGGALAKMKAELSMVRTKTRLASRTLTKLAVELHQISSSEAAEPPTSEDEITGNRKSALKPDPANSIPGAPAEAEVPRLTKQQQVEADRCLDATRAFLQQLIGSSIQMSFEDADLKTGGNPDRVEQVWEGPTDSEFPVFLAAGWSVKHPDEVAGVAQGRKSLDLRIWLVPKSLQASRGLEWIEGELELWISSRKLDPTCIRFSVSRSPDRPTSDLISGFAGKYAAKYDGTEPTILVASLHHLEWIQKRVVVSLEQVP